ncbi:hypothetical protein Ciccas_007123 [Cichlidogyrus casuarinus]|uniref:Ig-like domain-containing protein n=1 Tax=Cichlidogyrus casuarinus TaxID=1844966 RepID=A0ABD2Q3T1_9PLAT
MGEQIMRPVREGIYQLDKYAVRFLPGRPGYVPKVAGQSENLRTYQLIIRFADSYDSQFFERDKATLLQQSSFKCQIEIPSTNRELWPHAEGQVIVKRLSAIMNRLTSQIINEGETLNLNCETNEHPQPNISWSRSNGQPFSLPNSPQRVLGKTLIVPNITQTDRGVYRCFAVNNVYHSVQYSVMIQVNYRPYIRRARVMGSYGQIPDANMNVVLECVVNGYPDPDLYWYKGVYNPITNNEPLFDNERYDLEKTTTFGAVGTNITDVFSTMLIRNIRNDDYGIYSCRAENKYGSAFVTVNLFCEFLYTPTLIPSDQSICQGSVCPMLEGNSITGIQQP